MSRPAPVPYDPELLAGMEGFRELFEPFPLRGETILASREHVESIIPPLETQVRGRAVLATEITIPAGAGNPEIAATLVRPATPAAGPVPGVLAIHGGGMVLGNRFFATPELIGLAERYSMVGLSVEYRLSPEHPGTAATEDCHAALVWLAEHADELGVDLGRLLVSGASAGGGLAAAVALMARDRSGPAIAGQLLNTPMLDDRNNTVSSHQYDGIGIWDRNNNHTGWAARLGAERGGDTVSAYCAPARAASLAGLPPAFIEVGAAEVFRDEAIDYASRIWAAGGSAELHVYAGAYHGFSGSSPEALVSRRANALRDSWIRRTLGVEAPAP
ncbi:alpha/beta hydrolase fold domain-containing protein [Paeniglutamicibacter sp. R2-26]|uniref:alpha/beta hydrolase fold domain-containing protein n=1 Tax=Paeniglutamicibacter sp. R2-26 TaxID=3144417 RepID=UPI003EE4E714